MKHSNDFMEVVADLDLNPETLIWRAGSPVKAEKSSKSINLDIPYTPFKFEAGLMPDKGLKPEIKKLNIRLYSGNILRVSVGEIEKESVMIEPSDDLSEIDLSFSETEKKINIIDNNGKIIAVFDKYQPPQSGWSTLQSPSFDSLSVVFFPKSSKASLNAYDQFFPEKVESIPIGFIENPKGENKERSTLFSFTSDANEHFVGTGERFRRMDLAGGTYSLENTDGLGNNSRRAYKNVPFFISSKGYGLFVHTTSHILLSVADVSTRAVQGKIEEDKLDIFIFDGKTPEEILKNYRRLTGFPPELPVWSYGTWMSRMTYFSADEIEKITSRMREEKYPCDVIHIDTGWFETDWVCEWKFSKERFPEPEKFMKRLKDDGYRVSLWQTPNIGEGNCLLEEAKEKRYLAPPKSGSVQSSSDFSGQNFGGQIDFTNPEAVAWYQDKIRNLIEMGAAVIKTDFGEKVQKDADYMNMPADKLHNIYSLLYQKAAFEQTQKSTGEGIIWARAGWAGCQRYPLHWGGDTAASWDGMAAVLRGGLHLGLSGFGFWSHDVPGFHGLPEFMNTPPSDNVYVRWTQFGVFTSHLRYHGTSPREPWYFPEIAPVVRKWLNLRYMLIPYFMEQAKITSQSGFPVLRAMLLQYPEDPVSWNIDDQFFCGNDLLVCPVMNDEGVRNVYLPEGVWYNLWTGEKINGEKWLKDIKSELSTIPVFVKENAEIPVYPEPVQCTDDMDSTKIIKITVNKTFKGISSFYTEPNLLP
ncbi:MAG: alpha-xylosidase [Spirochaetales bacterium]|nr:alpha-xylosidase [Spirochaetales bacterium]